jgi:segregation and condensation protein B
MSDALSLSARCEAILFASARAWQRRKLAEACEVLTDDIDLALKELGLRLDESGSALQLVEHGQEIELVTRGEYASLLRQVFTQDAAGELSRPSLETLAILAYRGPLTRPELEQIRGVQCARISRNGERRTSWSSDLSGDLGLLEAFWPVWS